MSTPTAHSNAVTGPTPRELWVGVWGGSVSVLLTRVRFRRRPLARGHAAQESCPVQDGAATMISARGSIEIINPGVRWRRVVAREPAVEACPALIDLRYYFRYWHAADERVPRLLPSEAWR
jgi:hypothetical protein